MARKGATILNADYGTFIGTPEQLRSMIGAMFSSAGIVNAQYCNWVVLDKPISTKGIETAIKETPRKQR